MAISECISGLVYGPPYGFGTHIDTISPKNLEIFMLGDYVFSHFYNVALGSIKLAILALLYKIFSITWFKRVVLMTAVFIVLWIITIEVVLGLLCRPIQSFWDSGVKGTCLNLVAFSYFTNISNLVTDIWIFCLPLPLILRLNTSRSKKIGLSAVFLIGLLTCIISAVRLSVVVAQGSPDFTWDGVALGAMSVFEPLGGILCANLPVIYTLFAKSINDMRSKYSRRTGSKQLSSDVKSGGFTSSHRHLDRDLNSDKWIELPHSNASANGSANREGDV